jgi:hypothetical protein
MNIHEIYISIILNHKQSVIITIMKKILIKKFLNSNQSFDENADKKSDG